MADRQKGSVGSNFPAGNRHPEGEGADRGGDSGVEAHLDTPVLRQADLYRKQFRMVPHRDARAASAARRGRGYAGAASEDAAPAASQECQDDRDNRRRAGAADGRLGKTMMRGGCIPEYIARWMTGFR